MTNNCAGLHVNQPPPPSPHMSEFMRLVITSEPTKMLLPDPFHNPSWAQVRLSMLAAIFISFNSSRTLITTTHRQPGEYPTQET